MKRAYCLVVLCVVIVGCSGKNQPSKIDSFINTYVSYISDYYADTSWRKDNLKNIIHPDCSPTGDTPSDYSSISYPAKIPEGTYIFDELNIKNIKPSVETISITNDVGSWVKKRTDIFFIEIEYSVDAYLDKENVFHKYDSIKKVNQYLVCVKDRKDGRYKLLDSIPGARWRFIKKTYFLANLDFFDLDKENLAEYH